MTDKERKTPDHYQDMSIGTLLKCLLLLTGKYIVKILLFALKQICKAIIWCTERIAEGWMATKMFWFSDSTQEKKNKVITWTNDAITLICKWSIESWGKTKVLLAKTARLTLEYAYISGRLFSEYSIKAAIALWNLSKLSLRTLRDLIVNSKPTFVKLWQIAKQLSNNAWHGSINGWRSFKYNFIIRKRKWDTFRKTKGMKGILIMMVQSFTNSINNFMDEEQTESNPESITEDDIIVQQMEERQGKAGKIGKKIFNGMKDILEGE